MRFAFPEKYLAAKVIVDGVEIDVHNAHLPPGVSRGLIKVHAFEAIRRRIEADTHVPRVLCGDFNAPVEEDAGGPISQSSGPGPNPTKSGGSWPRSGSWTASTCGTSTETSMIARIPFPTHTSQGR